MHIREVVRPEAVADVSNMSFADAPDPKNQQSAAISLSRIDFGEEHSNGTFGSNTTTTTSQVRSVDSRPRFFKVRRSFFFKFQEKKNIYISAQLELEAWSIERSSHHTRDDR